MIRVGGVGAKRDIATKVEEEARKSVSQSSGVARAGAERGGCWKRRPPLAAYMVKDSFQTGESVFFAGLLSLLCRLQESFTNGSGVPGEPGGTARDGLGRRRGRGGWEWEGKGGSGRVTVVEVRVHLLLTY